MNSITQRTYTHQNGYSGNQFSFYAQTENKKITEFTIELKGKLNTEAMRLLSKDLKTFADTIDNTENPVFNVTPQVTTAASPDSNTDTKGSENAPVTKG